MEASIDVLQPTGDVLEIRFGCGYSATQIMKYNPKSYTVIECDSVVIKKAKEWAKKYPDYSYPYCRRKMARKITCHLGIFDEIYFDDYPWILQKNPKISKKLFLKND